MTDARSRISLRRDVRSPISNSPAHAGSGWTMVGLKGLFLLLTGIGIVALGPGRSSAQSPDTVVVSWTAPGDDGSTGTATAYDLRYSQSPITAANFSSATPVSQMPAPRSAGTQQRIVVRGLARGTTYYFAIRTVDDVGNWSQVSNVARWDWIYDTAPPRAPYGLVAARESDNVRVHWVANTEPDLAGYMVYRSPSPDGPFTALNEAPITTTEYLDTAIPSSSTLFYQVTAWDASHNESARSPVASLSLDGSSTEYAMEAPFPNPSGSNQDVRIPVVVPPQIDATAVVDVLDSGGRRVRRIPIGTMPVGRQEVVWDGKNESGRDIAPGVYSGWLIAGSLRTSVRLLRVP